MNADGGDTIKLYSHWRATAPYRVRIALALKGIGFDYAPVHLGQGRQHGQEYLAVASQRLLPALEVDGAVLIQSLPIIEWLEEVYPMPPLLPDDPQQRATVRAIAAIIAADIHPLNNLRVLQALAELGVGELSRDNWAARWINSGFETIEPMVARFGRGFAFGATPTMADCCLVPQVYSARRFQVDLSPFPAIVSAAANAAEHPAFISAHPDQQPDAEAKAP